MKKVLSYVFYSKNYLKIVFCAVLAGASQPLIAWSFSGLSEVFMTSEPMSEVIISNSILLILALIMAWAAVDVKTDITYNAEMRLRSHVFSKIYSMPIGCFQGKDSGAYYNQIGRDVQLIQTHLFDPSVNLVSDILSIIFIAGLMLYCHWVSLIIVLLFLIPLVVNNIFMPKKIETCQELSMNVLTEMVVKLKDVLSGFISARFQEGEAYIKGVMNQHFSEAADAEKKIKKLSNMSAMFANASVTISQFSGLFAAFYLIGKSEINFSKFILIFQLGMIISQPIVDLINSVVAIKSSSPYIQNTLNLLGNYKETERFLLDEICQISLEHVSFNYDKRERAVLQDFNYRFEKGKKYLLIGESGSGKTTLIKLLLGMLRPMEGEIKYNQMKQQDISDSEIYHHCALVPQQVYIFDDTIRRNLDLSGRCTDDELMAIIKKVQLESFFKVNNYSLDTRISNETTEVSGGEKSRIALARTLAQHKSVVIYDEVLANLDSMNAKIIENMILSDNDRIVIHITHTSTPELFDKYDDVIRFRIL